MSEQIDKIYKEYYDRYLDLVESDEFYNYLVTNIGAGKNKISFYHKKKDKKIDDRWITRIEDAIIPLDTIIRNPRRFIVQEDEIVPIEKARRITNESVRHLAQHTNLIARVDGDRVTPNEILNVYREESFDIYENRFIYTLLQNVSRFVEARRNVLFNITDDEEIAEFGMEGTFKHAGENITYKVEMSAMSTNDLIDADTKHMGAFARIERIDRIIKEFLGSPFAKTMRGSAPVRPPIMRTNVIMKDPNFKQCLTLWQFIETYNEVGYTIEMINEYKELDDDAVFALYNQMALNYLFVKKQSDTDEEVDLTKAKKRKILRPKFVKNIVEEITENYDITEVEIKKVFLDEINRSIKKREKEDAKIAQAIKEALSADAKAKAEAERLRKEEEKRLAAIEREKIAKQKAREAARIAKEKEKERLAKERALERERKAKEKAKALKEAQKAREKAKRDKEKAAELAKQRAIANKEKARKKAALDKEREAERIKQNKLRAKEKEKERALKLQAEQKEKAAAAKQKQKEKAQADALKLKEKEKEQKQKQKDRERLAREKATAIAKEKERIAREKAKAKESAEREKAKEKERLAKEKARAKEKERAAAEKERLKQKQKERREKEKAKEAERKAKEKERLAKAKAKSKAAKSNKA